MKFPKRVVGGVLFVMLVVLGLWGAVRSHGSAAHTARTASLFSMLAARPDSSGMTSGKLRARNMGPVVNSSDRDFGPCVTADGDELYFISHRPGGLGIGDVWRATRINNNDTEWSVPTNVRDINSESEESSVWIAADRRRVILSSNRDSPGNNDTKLWEARLENSTWTKLRSVDITFDPNMEQVEPTASAEGSVIIFVWKDNRLRGWGDQPWFPKSPGNSGRPTVSSRIPEPTPTSKICISHLHADGKWSYPVSLGSKINTEFGEGSPFLAPDGETLYFFSFRPGGFGGADIYRSKFLGPTDTNWSPPILLPEPVNSKYDDIFFSVGASGDVAYLTSNRKGGCGKSDIWQILGHP